MAVPIVKRRNAAALPWMRAAGFAGMAYLALAALGFYPSGVAPALALTIGTLGLLAPGVGVLVFLVAVGIPLVAADVLAGALFLVLGFGSVQYLTESDARVFLVIGLAFAATLVKAEWGVAVLAGYLFGASEGAVVALVACLVIQGAGLLIGAPSMGTLASGGTQPVVDLAALSVFKDPLAFRWIAPALSRIDPAAFIKTVTSARDLVLFAVQPLMWAAAAAAAGLLRRPVGDAKRPVMGLVTTGAATVGLALVASGASVLLHGPVRLAALGLGAAAALAVALVVTSASEWLFTPFIQARASGRSATEDADVDELLRTISTAEEALTSRHTVHKSVLLTDMKSFSRMTEELGSTETAKLVQRHRDLLLPLIEQAGGHGKSTGGDGLLAAFDGPAAALEAAVRMQRALAEYNASRAGGQDVLIRAGIASGEVVLDKGGKPFLGDALNRAARVMSLADGGQVFTTQQDLTAAGQVAYEAVVHGEFRLKNIVAPVEIVEILWREDQEAKPPQQVTSD